MISCMTCLAPTAAAAGNDPRIIVTLGDSYSAGEGIEPFYGQDKSLKQKVKDQDWLAHRSQNSWGSMLTLDGSPVTRGKNWFFAAASGAETKDIMGSQSVSYKKYTKTGVLTGTAELDPQINIFDGLTLTGNDFVTVSIGGNDIGFAQMMLSSIIQAIKDGFSAKIAETVISGLPEEYQALSAVSLSDLIKDKKDSFNANGGTRSKIKAAYQSIAQRSGDASIIVVGYPKLFAADGFSFRISIMNVSLFPSIAKKVNSAVDWFNKELQGIVEECRSEGMNICFVEPSAFSGHEAYTQNAYITGITVGASAEDIDDTAMIGGGTMHPNASGAAAYAAAVQAKIDELSGNDTASVKAEADKDTAAVKMRAQLGSDNSLTVSWDKISGAEKYILYYEMDGKNVKLGETSKTKLTLKNAANDFTYKFSLKVKKGSRISDASAGYKLSFNVYYKPAVKLTCKNSKITVSWKKVTGAEKYRVYKLVNGKLKLVSETAKNTVTYGKIKSGETYTYAVTAYVNGKWTTLSKSDRASVKAA